MLVLNKRAVMLIPDPVTLLLLQTSSTAAFVLMLSWFGIAQLQYPTPHTLKQFAYVACIFLGTIYANMRVVQHAGVNLFLVLRCSTPLIVSVMDAVWLGRELPNGRSVGALLGISTCGGVYAYLKATASVEERSITNEDSLIFFSCMWLVIFVIDMVFIKYVIESTNTTGWGAAAMQNAWASLFLLVAWVGEGLVASDGEPMEWTAPSLVVVGGTCLVGTLLSYSGMSLRTKMTATMFTVVGVVCKMLSILLNELWIGEDGTEWPRLVCILGCIVFSSQYRQAPLRKAPVAGLAVP